MERKFEQIINEGKELGAPVEAINAELKAAGANFHLNPDGGVSNWTVAEMAEGFNSDEGEHAEVKHLHDCMRFSPDKAGTEETVWTPEGQYRITFDEDGHPVKAVRLGS